MATLEIARSAPTETAEVRTAFLVIDTESIPDGRLLSLVKFPGQNLTDDEAIAQAQLEARTASPTGSDFLPVSFQIPVSVCVARVGADFSLQAVTCLDAPRFRPREIVAKFWLGLPRYPRSKLVTFNGRGFDMPLLELAAFRYGLSGRDYFQTNRNRFNGHVDLLDWLTNFGACRLAGGLNLLAKLIGKPGKMDVDGAQVWQMYQDERYQDINDYCMFDTLDTYFVFLRTRVMTGDISTAQEAELTANALEFLASRAGELPHLRHYLRAWDDGQPWP